MNSIPSTENKQLSRQGARLACLNTIVGCTLFTVIDTLPLLIDELSMFNIALIIILALVASLLSLPLAIIGGYALGWLLEKTQWYKQSKAKVIVSGVIIASATVMVIFVLGGFLELCVGSHGKCEEDFVAYATEVIVRDLSNSPLTQVGRLFVSRFINALLIAAVCGGITAWQLSQAARQKPI